MQPKSALTPDHGIFKLCPGRIRSLLRPFAALILATEDPFFLAMADKVSPLATVYLEPVDFLAVDLEGVDFFFVVLWEATVFLLEDDLEAEEEDEEGGGAFFVPLKAYGLAGGSGWEGKEAGAGGVWYFGVVEA